MYFGFSFPPTMRFPAFVLLLMLASPLSAQTVVVWPTNRSSTPSSPKTPRSKRSAPASVSPRARSGTRKPASCSSATSRPAACTASIPPRRPRPRRRSSATRATKPTATPSTPPAISTPANTRPAASPAPGPTARSMSSPTVSRASCSTRPTTWSSNATAPCGSPIRATAWKNVRRNRPRSTCFASTRKRVSCVRCSAISRDRTACVSRPTRPYSTSPTAARTCTSSASTTWAATTR